MQVPQQLLHLQQLQAVVAGAVAVVSLSHAIKTLFMSTPFHSLVAGMSAPYSCSA